MLAFPDEGHGCFSRATGSAAKRSESGSTSATARRPLTLPLPCDRHARPRILPRSRSWARVLGSVPLRAMPPPVQVPDSRIVALPAAEIRRRFVDFFAERGHAVVPSASLVPAGDATLLFTNSGMVQFKDVLIGAETRSYSRAVDYQRCLRVAGKHNDFEEVGRTPRHHTLFEMLGNWSFGDYFKREAIQWAWDFLTRDLGIPGDRLAATTYTDDEVAWNIWRDEIGLPPERMAKWGDVDAGDDHNFWRMADTGPCGPCSEIHFDRGTPVLRGPGVRAGPLRDLPALARDLEPRVHGVRPAAGRPSPAAVHQRRHRDGPRAAGERPPAGADQLRHGPVHADPRPDARADRPRPGGVRSRALQLPGDRRPLAGGHLPDRRRRPAVQRGSRLRPAPDPAPGGSPRAAARAPRTVHGRGGDGRDRGHGRGLPAPARAADARSST